MPHHHALHDGHASTGTVGTAALTMSGYGRVLVEHHVAPVEVATATAEATADLVRLAAQASPQALDLARAVLEQSVTDAAWGAQTGPVLAQRDTARLLATTEQAVSKDRRPLRLRNRDGRPVYPVVQFDGRSRLDGVADVVTTLASSLQPLASSLQPPASSLQPPAADRGRPAHGGEPCAGRPSPGRPAEGR